MTMSDSNSKTKYVKAIHPFKPTHTDELCFQKGDNIQVTQMIDGGWWEGTLNGVTGWFPSNYVIEATAGGDGNAQSINSGNVDLKSVTKESANRDLVLQSLHSSEKSFVTDMERLVQGFLKNLDAKSILPSSDCVVLLSSIEEIIVLHTGILRDLEAIFTLNTNNQRIGQLFLNLANQVQGFHKKYCSIHPKIAILLQAKRDEVNTFMECLGAQSPGSMTLTSYLSKPLRHLEKYSSVMQEIDRHSDENHTDREDLLKAVSVYRDIYQTCNNTRRQREMEQEILCSEIKGWEGETLSQLGEIQLLSHCRVVALSPSLTSSSLSAADVAEKQDRLLLLCPGVLIFLSVSPRVSGYSFEGKLPAYGTIVSSVEDCDNFSNVFEILSSSTNTRLLVSCSSTQEKNKWLQLLRQPVKLGPVGVVSKNLQYNSNVLPNLHSVFNTSHIQSPTTSLPSTSSIFNSGSSNIRSSIIFNQIRPSSQSPVVVNSPQQFANTQSSSAGSTSSASSSYNPNVVTLSQSHFYLPSLINTQTPVCQQVPQRGFISNLRPYPPLRPSVLIKDDGTRSPRSNRRIMGSSRKKPGQFRERILTQEEYLVYKKIDDTKVLQEDALMLRVIESYCTSAKNRHAVNSSIFDGPQVLIAEEEKIILEEAKDNQIVVEEKTLVDTVYSLRDQVRELRQDQHLLRKELEAEKKARRNLEMFVRQSLKSNQQNASKLDPTAESSAPVSGVSNPSVSNQNCTINGINNGSGE